MFDWDKFYTTFKVKLEKSARCTVGRYTEDKPTSFPYVDVALMDLSGWNYDNRGNEGSERPMIQITVYSTGTLADNTCQTISKAAKEIMLEYGFMRMTGAIPVINTSDSKVKRWVSRYRRTFGSEDTLTKLH